MMTSPFLLLPCSSNEEIHDIRLYSLEEKKSFTTITIPQSSVSFDKCVGSSHGWLVLLDKQANPHLFNPFKRTQIRLPPSNTLKFNSNFFYSSTKIHKVALSSNPSNSQVKTYAVVVLFGFPSHMKIAFCRVGDEEWNDLDREGKTYYDVVICDETNRAFALGPGPSVVSWDLNQIVPEKKMIIQDSYTRLLNQESFPSDLYSSNWYIVLSLGQIYIIVRYIGDFVRYDGKVVYEGDTLTNDDAEPLVCPYKTVDFHVFKLDREGNGCIKVETFNDFALFLGGNQSTIFSTINHPKLESSVIYFTDDYLERIDEDYMYGGHDIGVFKLREGTIHPVLDFEEHKIAPPPLWIID